MRAILTKIKPASGFSHFVHILLQMLLPFLLFVFTRLHLSVLAGILVVLSKWRMFAVRPRYWAANIRANAVDILVGVSFVLFMDQTRSISWQILWSGLYALWLVFIKPRSSLFFVTIQAGIGQTLALLAIFLNWGYAPLWWLILATWTVCYACARHYFTSFDEDHTSLFAHTWGYLMACVVWVLGHWLLFYGYLAQVTLLITAVGFCWASLYYLDETDRLSPLWRRQYVFMTVALVVVLLVFADWSGA
jgi:hypothetical protein